MKHLKIVSLALLGLSFSAEALPSGRLIQDIRSIIGGVSVEADDPVASTTVALLSERGTAQSLCTGVLVAPDLVLTAAHCLVADAAKTKVVFRRDIFNEEGGPMIAAKGQVYHPNFLSAGRKKDKYDIALLSFEGGLPQGYAVASLLEDADALHGGQEVTLAGYGLIGDFESEEAKKAPHILRKVDTKIVEPAFGETEVLIDQNEGKAGACDGDSGGPAFVQVGDKSLVFGIASRLSEKQPGSGSYSCETTVIYTRLLAHQAFLTEAAEMLRAEAQ